MRSLARLVASAAACSILMCGAVNAQGIISAVGAAVELCNQVNSVVTTIRSGYDTFRAVANATKNGLPPPRFELPLSESEQRRLDSDRIQQLLVGIADIRTRLIAMERWQSESEDRDRASEQRALYYRAYANSELALSAVREALSIPAEQRSENLRARLQMRLDDVVSDALHAEAMGRGAVGEHYVAAANASTLALVALRSVEPNEASALEFGKRDRILRAISALEQAIAVAESDGSRLQQMALTETHAYRTRLNALVRRREVAALVNESSVFHEGEQQACFETVARYITRECRGDECGMLPWEQHRNVTVPSRYQQTRYVFTLSRTSAGALNLMNALDPRAPSTISETERPAPQCPQRGDPQSAWLEVVNVYNDALLAATPVGGRAATAIGALELAGATRESLATLRGRM